MKALTLTQPWASLVAVGAKRIETRSWRTSYRGPLAIHAAKGFPGEAKRFCESKIVQEALGWQYEPNWNLTAVKSKSIHVGCVIAICDLVDCKEILKDMPPCLPTFYQNRYMVAPAAPELYFGDYTPGRYGWLLENIKVLPEPIPAKGALSLWEWEAAR